MPFHDGADRRRIGHPGRCPGNAGCDGVGKRKGPPEGNPGQTRVPLTVPDDPGLGAVCQYPPRSALEVFVLEDCLYSD